MLNIESRHFDETLKKLISQDRSSDTKKHMEEAERYYQGEHDILKYRLFYIDNNGQRIEELNRSNIRIPHPFLTELIDQKTNYLLSNKIEFKTNDEDLDELLADYLDEDFQVIIKETLEGASVKGYENVYFYYDDNNKIQFETADSYHLIFITDEQEEVVQVIRHYRTTETDERGNEIEIYKAELYDNQVCHYFVMDKDGKYKLEESVYHRSIVQGEDKRPLDNTRIPFITLRNNRRLTTDLKPIKALIDDYDLMAGSLSNNLVDFDYPIYAVKGFQGDNLNDLITNLQTRKTINVGSDGGLDVKTIDIPVEARRMKLDLDRESIYKFGMGFDSTANLGDRALTNLGIQSRYSSLNIKVNKAETELRSFLRTILDLIVENIQERFDIEIESSDIEIVITREIIENERERAETAMTEAQAKSLTVQTLMSAGVVLGYEAIVDQLGEVLDIQDPTLEMGVGLIE